MRSIVLIVLFNVVSFGGFGQNTISTLLKQREILTPQYEMTPAGSKILYLPMDYGKSAFSYRQKDVIKSLKNAEIERIDLVYSDYPASTDFSGLTQRRLETLQQALPTAFLGKGIEFRKIRQTFGSTRETASELQHGFFIYFRPLPYPGSGKKEVGKLTDLLGERPKKPLTDTSGIAWCSQTLTMEDTTGLELEALPENYTRTISRISVKEAIARKLIDKKDEKNYLDLGDSVFCIDDVRDGGCDFGDYAFYDLTDTTITQVFKRHHWAHSMIIADVTGSMYPYTAQLLKWLQLSLTDKQNTYFTFFNDGDDMPDDKKVIGKTGGIYSVGTNSYDEVEKIIKTAMANGSGGDLPENNIEALLSSDKVCSSCDSIIMIVDNWAPIKDISLLASWHKPVKVVVCGVFDKVNKDYLKLARDTKGSIHLIEEDIYTLSELKEGETIKIHGVTYKLIGGNFVDVAEYKGIL
jgi:hypothetical protein